jgi:hypothetical protein
MIKRSAHLTRLLIEGISAYSPYRGARLSYVRERDPQSTIIAVDLTAKMDLHQAIRVLWNRGELSEQEVKMLMFVMMDGRLSRRDISAMIKEKEGLFVDQRTISRRLESAYWKISKFLGWEYQDKRMFQIIAKQMGKTYPFILSDEECRKVQEQWERV